MPSLPVLAEGPRDASPPWPRISIATGSERDAGHQQDHAVDGDGQRRRNGFRPSSRSTNGTSESQNSRWRLAQRIAAARPACGLEQVMVVVPVDADVDEAQHVAERTGSSGRSAARSEPCGDLQLEHHDGDDDGDHAIAEGFEAAFGHGPRYKQIGQGLPGSVPPYSARHADERSGRRCIVRMVAAR